MDMKFRSNRFLSLVPYPLSLVFSRSKKAQAMTEVVLLFPIFMIVLFITVKIFAILVLVQKMEIASYYAARRWQLESHLHSQYASGFDKGLEISIKEKVSEYLGFNNHAVSKFLTLRNNGLQLSIERTQVWNVVTITVYTNSAGVGLLCKYPMQAVCTRPAYGIACDSGYAYICQGGKSLQTIKYVPNRDRPIAFILPGLQ